MDTIDNAIRAREGLNNTNLIDDNLKMNIYYATIPRINFQDNNSGGVDYTILKQKIHEKKQENFMSVTPSMKPQIV